MGRLVLLAVRVTAPGLVALLWTSALFAQVPAQPSGSSHDSVREVAPPPGGPPTPPAPPESPSEPGNEPALPPGPAPEPPPAESAPAPKPDQSRAKKRRSARPDEARGERAPQTRPGTGQGADGIDFLSEASPWVELSLTSFYLNERVDHFMNLGVQVGAYLFEHLRLTGRVVTPLEEVKDSYSRYASSSAPSASGVYNQIDSRSMAVLYGASVGLIVKNSRSFVFGPGLTLLRTDVEAYGSAWLVTLPFEWTLRSGLRVGFEFGLGRAFGGQVRELCIVSGSPRRGCGIRTVDRPSGPALMAQFSMGWTLGKL